MRSRRQIPAVSKVLEQIAAADLPRPLVVQTIREELAREFPRIVRDLVYYSSRETAWEKHLADALLGLGFTK